MSTQSPTVLERILAETREEVERRKRELPLPGDRSARAPWRRFHEALIRPGIGVIAEFKRRSPSAGALREDAQVAQIVSAYERGGAVALSVLTEGPNFDGSLEDLRTARAASGLPILRKDFIVDAYQLHEALAAGADAVLLIVAALEPGELESLHDAAHGIGLEVLVEVHDREELQMALALGAQIDRDQQPRPEGLQRRRGAHGSADGGDPGRGHRGLGVGDRDLRATAHAAARRRPGGAGGGVADALGAPESALRALRAAVGGAD